MEAAGGEQRELLIQRLRAAVHYTTGCLCQDVAEDKGVLFSKQTVAAISEITFRQCENFARDLEMFASGAGWFGSDRSLLAYLWFVWLLQGAFLHLLVNSQEHPSEGFKC
ncbi:centromere protein S isoform 2 [Gallus gallus]|uniref:centromere protein S isoform 2 n=1 Tax=Gallus gallus TaxID=9031 RepID=UPI001D1A3299|nr:centromere protein S isoform 2 [Gallus gallus]